MDPTLTIARWRAMADSIYIPTIIRKADCCSTRTFDSGRLRRLGRISLSIRIFQNLQRILRTDECAGMERAIAADLDINIVGTHMVLLHLNHSFDVWRMKVYRKALPQFKPEERAA